MWSNKVGILLFNLSKNQNKDIVKVFCEGITSKKIVVSSSKFFKKVKCVLKKEKDASTSIWNFQKIYEIIIIILKI